MKMTPVYPDPITAALVHYTFCYGAAAGGAPRRAGYWLCCRGAACHDARNDNWRAQAARAAALDAASLSPTTEA